MVKHLILFTIGGVLYTMLEIFWRGYTHPSMLVVGGLAFVAIGLINEFFSWEMPIWGQCGIATLFITVLEFVSGCIINLWLGWNVWDYSNIPLNLYGQICLKMSVAWYFLSAIGIFLDDFLRRKLFGEEYKGYIFICKRFDTWILSMIKKKFGLKG